ncbi:conserved hypothetical protein [Burkholderia cenocepacia HI2424]|uniref:Uncharacterized protein n=1 Tax=Burkholderia orbicola (strain AU 1054) TaxID=331271 RepID=A0A0H2XUC6_BURO1|nr:conserved hypothetical protein [Burkholderia cenocepacia HI2424]
MRAHGAHAVARRSVDGLAPEHEIGGRRRRQQQDGPHRGKTDQHGRDVQHLDSSLFRQRYSTPACLPDLTHRPRVAFRQIMHSCYRLERSRDRRRLPAP